MHSEKSEYWLENRFFAGFIAVNALLAAAVIFAGTGIVPLGTVAPCAFFLKTGFYCPGCGGTRGLYSLSRGDLAGAFFYYPALIYFIAFDIVFTASNGARLISERTGALPKIKAMRLRSVYFILLLAIIAVNCIVRNVLWKFWGIGL